MTNFSLTLYRCSDFGKKHKLEIFLFFSTFLIYLFTTGQFVSVNEYSHLALTMAIVENGTFSVNAYVSWFEIKGGVLDVHYYNGNYYSDKAPGLSFLGVPVYIIGKTFGLSKSTILFSLLCINDFFAALSVVLVYRLCNFLESDRQINILTSLTYAFGTIAWVYAGTFFSHSTAVFFVLMATYLMFSYIRKTDDYMRLFFAGLSIGYGILVEYTTIFIAFTLGTYFILNKKGKKLWLFFLPIGFFLLVLGTYNYLLYNNPFTISYVALVSGTSSSIFSLGWLQVFQTPLYIGCFGLLFSPQNGLFFYSPVLLFFIYGNYLIHKRLKNESLFFLFSFLSLLCFYSIYNWRGGWCYGPRFLSSVIPFITIPLSSTISKFKGKLFFQILFSILLGFSIFATALGALVDPIPPDALIVIPLIWNLSYLIRKGRFHSTLLLATHLDPLLLFIIIYSLILLLITTAFHFGNKNYAKENHHYGRLLKLIKKTFSHDKTED